MPSAEPGLEALFVEGSRGRLFALLHRPPASGVLRGACLCLAPFGEEMNKSRRMLALAARALASSGWSVLQVDDFGTGDSEGDFGDADWSTWLEDSVIVARWLEARTGARPWYWGVRAGCLRAAGLAARQAPPGMLWWQPVVSGKQHLQQLLRVKVASAMLEGAAGGRERVQDLLESLAAGKGVEVGGYLLGTGLARGLEGATLNAVSGTGPLIWVEVSGAAQAALSPVSARAVEHWRDRGWTCAVNVVSGPAFWQTQEIEEAPALVEHSVKHMGRPYG